MRKLTEQNFKPFDYTDKVMKIYLKTVVKTFSSLGNRINVLKFDEINSRNKGEQAIFKYVKKAYVDMYDECLEMYEAIAKQMYAYVRKGDKYKFNEKKFVKEFIENPDRVTKYIFKDETDRKRSRLLEALLAVMLAKKMTFKVELNVAMKLWSKQALQTADDIAMAALIQAYKDAGVKKVIWCTQEDERVCEDCEPLDGQVYPIDEMPDFPQHYACRCFVIPYT